MLFGATQNTITKDLAQIVAELIHTGLPILVVSNFLSLKINIISLAAYNNVR